MNGAQSLVSKQRIAELLNLVFLRGAFCHEGQVAVKRLARMGQPAIDAMLRRLQRPIMSELHPRDLAESIDAFFWEVARKAPGKLIEVINSHPDWPALYFALGNAKDRRSIDVLIAGLTDKHYIIRSACCISLIRRKSKRAVPYLIEALRDRSHMVKFEVVRAMEKNKMYRLPEAIPYLERIVADRSVAKHSPGLAKSALKLVERLWGKTR